MRLNVGDTVLIADAAGDNAAIVIVLDTPAEEEVMGLYRAVIADSAAPEEEAGCETVFSARVVHAILERA